MKAWEICKEENVGKKFKDSDGKEWEVVEVYMSCEYDLRSKVGCLITDSLAVSEIAELDFEEFIDWSKVPVDTKILVKNFNCHLWHRRYFSKFENGKIHAFDNGGDSWSNEGETTWDYVKLYKEGEE